jgi:hypothetical protein
MAVRVKRCGLDNLTMAAGKKRRAESVYVQRIICSSHFDL